MGWIETRIKAEYRKHQKLNWAKIAESKIVTELRDRGIITIDIFNNYIKQNNINSESKEVKE